MTCDELMKSIVTAQEQMLKHSIEANSVILNGKKYGKLIENCPPNIKPTIFGMAVKAEYAMPDDYDFLVQYDPPKPQTNADRIRAMSGEELAEKFFPFLCVHVLDDKVICKDDGCKKCWMRWLREEVKE